MDNDNYQPFIKVSCIPFSNKYSGVDKGRSTFKVEKLNSSSSSNLRSTTLGRYLPSNISDEEITFVESFSMIQRPSSSKRSPSKRSDAPSPRTTSATLNRVGTSKTNPNSLRPNSSLASHSYKSKDLDKMRANLDFITEQLSVIEQRLPSVQHRVEEKTSEKVPVQLPSSVLPYQTCEAPYDATEFRDDLLVPATPAYYARLSSSLADRYDHAVMRAMHGDTDKKALVSMIHRELEEWRASNAKTVSLQTDPNLLGATDKQIDSNPEPETTVARGPVSTAASHRDPSTSQGSSRFGDDGSVDMDYEFPSFDKFISQQPKFSGRNSERAESARSYEDPSANLQVIERTANLLKQVEHHWKKSLFLDNPFVSPKSVSDINDSDSDNYVEKLAAIRFNKSIHFSQNNQIGKDRSKPIVGYFQKEGKLHHPQTEHLVNHGGDGPVRKEAHRRPQRGLVARGGASMAPGRAPLIRGEGPLTHGAVPLFRGGAHVPRGSVPLGRAREPARSQPAEAKKVASTGSILDTQKAVPKRSSSLQSTPRRHIAEVATNTDPFPRNNTFFDIRCVEEPAEVPRMMVQVLPTVDIRPDLRIQTGPAISIGAAASAPARPAPSNVAVFSCVHNGAPEQYFSRKQSAPSENGSAVSEEALAAELELRSLSENVLYRVRAGGCGQQLVNSLFTLVDLLSQNVSERTRAPSGSVPRDLPGRMEAVSDLLSDELKTWGEQSDQHYKRIDNILKHLILDIRLARGNEDLLTVHRELGINNGVSKESTVKEFCKEMREESPRLKASPRRGCLKSNVRLSASRPIVISQQNTPRQEVSLEQKLIHEKCRKVQHLEKVYSINHELEMLEKMDEAILKSAAEAVRVEKTRSSRSSSRRSSAAVLTHESSSIDPADIPPPSETPESSSPTEELPSASASQASPSQPVSPCPDEDSARDDMASDKSDASVEEDIVDDSEAEVDDVPSSHHSSPTQIRTQSLNETYVVEEHDANEDSSNNKTSSRQILNKESVHSDYDEDFEQDESEQHTSAPEEEKNEDFEEPDTVKHTIIPATKHSSTQSLCEKKVLKRKSSKERRCMRSPQSLSSGAKASDGSDATDPIKPLKGFVTKSEPVKSEDDSPPKLLTVTNPDNYTLLEVKLPKSSTKFVKVHSKNKAGEIKLSYINPKHTTNEPDISSSDSSTQKSPLKIKPSKEMEDKEIFLREAMNSSLLRSIFEEQIAKMITKFNETNQLALSSTSATQSGLKINQGVQSDIEFSPCSIQKGSSKSVQAGEGNLLLSSPKVKLNTEGTLLRSSSPIETKKPSEGMRPYSAETSIKSCSEHLPSSASSSKSLHNFGETNHLEYERDVTLHQFNSDEFIIYPRLHPQPFLASQDMSHHETSPKDVSDSFLLEKSDEIKKHALDVQRTDTTILDETHTNINENSNLGESSTSEIIHPVSAINSASLSKESLHIDAKPAPVIETTSLVIPEISNLTLQSGSLNLLDCSTETKNSEKLELPVTSTLQLFASDSEAKSKLSEISANKIIKTSSSSPAPKTGSRHTDVPGEGSSRQIPFSGFTTESITDAIAESLQSKVSKNKQKSVKSSMSSSKISLLKKKVSRPVWSSSREEDYDSTTSTWTSTGSTTSEEPYSENTCNGLGSSPPTSALHALRTTRMATSDPLLFTHSSSSDSSIDDWHLSAISDDILSDIPHLNQYLQSLAGPSRIRRCSRHMDTTNSSKRLT